MNEDDENIVSKVDYQDIEAVCLAMEYAAMNDNMSVFNAIDAEFQRVIQEIRAAKTDSQRKDS